MLVRNDERSRKRQKNEEKGYFICKYAKKVVLLRREMKSQEQYA